MASAMALAMAGATATVAHSAAPLAPRLAEGSTISTISGTTSGVSRVVGMRYCSKPVVSPGWNSSLRANPDPHRHGALYLSFQPLRIDDASHIVGSHDPQHPHRPLFRVDLHLRHVGRGHSAPDTGSGSRSVSRASGQDGRFP